MKRKSAIVIAIFIMSIGFAAVSTTLIIKGNTSISENTDDFSVIFTSASLDGQDVYTNVISQDKKTITFDTSDLKTLNQTSVLNYEVTNNSSNYDAEVSVNCKVKENTTAKYTSIKNELEGNATVIKAKTSLNGTLTVTLNKTATEEVREEYVCVLSFNAIERDELGKGIPEPVSFTTDSWQTIQKAVQTGNTELYNIGDTKEVDLGTFGTHTVRIANKSECTTETSETACGFVVEFVNCITNYKMFEERTNVGGWKASIARTYINTDIYEMLPDDLKKIIVDTKVISGHGSTSGEENFETIDKLYLLSTKEIYGSPIYDTVGSDTRQLDYYNKVGAATNSSRAQKNGGTESSWWLRSSNYAYSINFLCVYSGGNVDSHSSNYDYGISPAFRIG